MSRRSSIRLSSTVTPEKTKDDPTILYCNYDNCPLNSLYQCTYCKSYRCIRHAKIMDNNTCICIKCITSNNTLYNIYGAMEINKNYEPKWKKNLKYFLSMQWIYCGARIEPY